MRERVRSETRDVEGYKVKRAAQNLIMLGCCCLTAGSPVVAEQSTYPRPPAPENVTISNGGLSITFNISWGAVVVAISNDKVAHGLNIVDTHDVGRELQVDQFLHLLIEGHESLMINPTQAGALGRQAFYMHPAGIRIPEVGSKVEQYKAGSSDFQAIISPLDYDTGKPTKWVYVEDVRISDQGVARFHFSFYNHETATYLLESEVPTLYSDWTDAFLYPTVSPYDSTLASYRDRTNGNWPVRMIHAGRWPSGHLRSHGWIANIDTKDNVGIFYTTPVGHPETYGTFPNAAFSGREPLGKSNVTTGKITCYPEDAYSIEYSVLVSTIKDGPSLISKQPAAIVKVLRNAPPRVSK